MSKWTRREFVGAAAAISATLASGVARAEATTAAAAPAIAPIAGITPAGELAQKIALTAARLTTHGTPAYTDEMVVADVALDERRRFFNFSGDVSGRYLEALSLMPAPGRSRESLDQLAAKILAHQRPDGRFGRAELAFTAAEIGPEHMALLWGNGRLLVGLMSYYTATGDAAALAAAHRLADFLLAVREAAKAPEVAKRLEGQGAFGIICFTQLVEGLVLLGRATGEQKYFTAAAEIVPTLPPRGVQHSHGYLSTLRGALMLHEATSDAAMLAHVEKLWGELTASPDYIVDGSVLEYFGWGDPTISSQLAAARAASGPLPRNEGCGLADLIRLTLNLYRVTGKDVYLEQAERCYLNSFAHNQFFTGDFGSRVWFSEGFTPTPSVDRAWWCCTMHGYRALHDVLESAVSEKDGVTSVHLFEDLDWRRAAHLRLRRTATGASIEFERPYASVLRVRLPKWSSATTVKRNGKPLSTANTAYLEVGRNFAAGERVEMHFALRTQIVTPRLQPQALDALDAKAQRVAVYSGPMLMVMDEEMDPYFFGEPWEGNTVSLAPEAAAAVDAKGRLRLPVRYQHVGFAGVLPTTMRPLGEKPAVDQRTIAVWLNCKRG